MNEDLNQLNRIDKHYLTNVLSNLASTEKGFNCDPVNLTSVLLKNVNIIVLQSATAALTSLTDSTTAGSSVEDRDEKAYNHTMFPGAAPEIDTSRRSDYDYYGALVYIVFILFWYSVAVVILIKMQTQNKDVYYFENYYDSDDKDVQNVLKSIREKNVKRQALEDLRDPGFRQRMWNIYLENSFSYKVRRFENKRIQHIDRKLKEYYGTELKTNTVTPGGGGASSRLNVHPDGYKTVDFSHLERNSSNSQFPHQKPVTNDNFFLLRDWNKLTDPSVAANIQMNQNTIHTTEPYRPNPHQLHSYMSVPTDTTRFRVEKLPDLV